MDGMVNTCERSINAVIRNKPKMLTGLGQKGTVAGTGSEGYPVMDTQRYRRTARTSPVLVNLAERGKPLSLLSRDREESREADRRRRGERGGKKRTPSCNGTDTGCNMTQRESGLTSLRCLGTRTMEESV